MHIAALIFEVYNVTELLYVLGQPRPCQILDNLIIYDWEDIAIYINILYKAV